MGDASRCLERVLQVQRRVRAESMGGGGGGTFCSACRMGSGEAALGQGSSGRSSSWWSPVCRCSTCRPTTAAQLRCSVPVAQPLPCEGPLCVSFLAVKCH